MLNGLNVGNQGSILIYLHFYSKCCNLNANKDKDQLPFVTNTQNFLLKKEEQIYHNPF